MDLRVDGQADVVDEERLMTLLMMMVLLMMLMICKRLSVLMLLLLMVMMLYNVLVPSSSVVLDDKAMLMTILIMEMTVFPSMSLMMLKMMTRMMTRMRWRFFAASLLAKCSLMLICISIVEMQCRRMQRVFFKSMTLIKLKVDVLTSTRLATTKAASASTTAELNSDTHNIISVEANNIETEESIKQRDAQSIIISNNVTQNKDMSNSIRDKNSIAKERQGIICIKLIIVRNNIRVHIEQASMSEQK